MFIAIPAWHSTPRIETSPPLNVLVAAIWQGGATGNTQKLKDFFLAFVGWLVLFSLERSVKQLISGPGTSPMSSNVAPPPPFSLAIIKSLRLLLAVAVGLGCLAGWGWVRINRPTAGQLVASKFEAVWKSPPHREAITGLKAKIEVPLWNRGGATVEITAVESGCGCTTPTVQPASIPPGGRAVLTAIGTPLSSGERSVAITVRTDSPPTPELRFSLKMISDRLPPFLLGVAGDFADIDGSSPHDSREFLVQTVEAGAAGKIPLIQTDLPFLQIMPLVITATPYDEAGLIQRSYRHQVDFRKRPPSGSFTGRIWAIDPWTLVPGGGVLVSHRANDSITVVPPTLTIAPSSTDPVTRRFLAVMTATEAPNLVVRAEGEDSHLLRVSELSEARTKRYHKFLVEIDTKDLRSTKTAALIVQREPDGQERVVVPVVFGGVES